MLKLSENFINALNGRTLSKGMVIKEDNRYFMITKDQDGFYLTNLTSGFHYSELFNTPLEMVVTHFGTVDGTTNNNYVIYDSMFHIEKF